MTKTGERIKTINEINGGTREPAYLFITNGKATYAKFLSFANLNHFDYFLFSSLFGVCFLICFISAS